MEWSLWGDIKLRLVLTSDTHGHHRKLKVPEGDIFIHAGDFLGWGTYEEMLDFNNWLKDIPCEHKLIIAGNHDKAAYTRTKEEIDGILSNATYLQDSSVIIEGKKFYGSPYTPEFAGWFFMLERGSQELKDKWDEIPLDTDVLISHGPPIYKLDADSFGHHFGCEDLRRRVKEVKPAYHIFGHNHRNDVTQDEHTIYINASFCMDGNIPTYDIVKVDL